MKISTARRRLSSREAGAVRARHLGLALVAALAIGTPAVAADYQADLRPMPVDDETKVFIAGKGEATASFDGGMLNVKGRFEGLPSNATEAFLMQSPYIGMPGKKVLDLTVVKSPSGEVSGSFKLNKTQAQALRTGRLYVQVNSEKAPPGYSWGPQGTVWGWLLPVHERVAQGVPQQGDWFLPQLDTPSR
jgi:hypothetical protein